MGRGRLNPPGGGGKFSYEVNDGLMNSWCQRQRQKRCPGEEVDAEDEVEEAETGGGEVEEEECGDEREEAEEAVPNLQMKSPHKRRHPPREEWIVNPDLYRRQQAAETDGDPDPPRGRRRTRAPDFLGVEKERGERRLELPPTLATQLHDLQTMRTDRVFTPTGPNPTGSCSPTPPATPRVTPIATPDTSPETTTVAPPRTWLEEEGVLPRKVAGDVFERHRHWSIGGGETDRECLYPMLDWTPRARRPPPSY